MNENYMNLAIQQAKKAYKYEEVPVGAIIVKNNKIIAISKACKKIKNWRLDDCEIYVTMEPCMMCCGAIEQSRIKKIIYGVKNENYGSTELLKNVEIISQVCEKECRELVRSFFKKRR